jgi:hypothetical protein
MSKRKKTQSVPTIDELLQTGSEHSDKYARKVVTECISKEVFDTPEMALQAYDKCMNIILCASKPFDASRWVVYELTHNQEPELTDKQLLYILKHIADYINPNSTDFGGKWKQQQETYDILKSYIVRIEKEFAENRPKTADIRETLKTLMQKEIADLPQRLEKLDDEKRLGIICKLMPYVFPKVEAVEASRGENKEWYDD